MLSVSRSFLFIIITFVCLVGLPVLVGAQGVSGLRVTPAALDSLRMEPGEVQSLSVTVTNLSDTEQTYFIQRRDIIDQDANRAPIFAPANREIMGIELSQWIEVASSTGPVAPGSSATVPFTLRAPQEVTPGSHFGALFFSVEAPEIETSGAAVGYEVAVPIAVRIAGDAVEAANIRQFATNRYLYGSPDVEFFVKIENTGSTMVRPSGPLRITNMFGQEVANLTFNESQGGIMPGKTIDFTLDWTGEVSAFGRYEAMINPVYGDTGGRRTLTSTVTFWVLPMNIVGPAVGILLTLLLITYIIIKLYIRRQLAQYSGGRRIVRRQSAGPSGFVVVTMALLTVTALFLIVLLLLFA